MDWRNKTIMEFIKLLEEEPCIWNFKIKDHKNRHLVAEAWNRIKNKFSEPCSVDELKRKRSSLQAHYRQLLRKIKESPKDASGNDEIYKPSWYAFEAMHNYMGAIYDSTQTPSTENLVLFVDAEQSEINYWEQKPDKRSRSYESNSRDSNIQRRLSEELSIDNYASPKLRKSETRSDSDSFKISKRKRGMRHTQNANERTNESFSIIEARSNHTENEKGENECDLYGQLLANKLKVLGVDDRLVLMNQIDNLVFNYIMNIRKPNSSSE